VLLISSSSSKHHRTLANKSKVSWGQQESVGSKHHQNPWTALLPIYSSPKECYSRSSSRSIVTACLPFLSVLLGDLGGPSAACTNRHHCWCKRRQQTRGSGSSSSNNFGMAPTASMAQAAAIDPPALTWRALAAGLGVGAVLCFSNMYFGLQVVQSLSWTQGNPIQIPFKSPRCTYVAA
jgi:hypothetical protein